ncbi:MAG: RDD family protein [Deltaproteobacteria bacterium]|nr:RDD family protein [Deltaproteobacteria bacterium]
MDRKLIFPRLGACFADGAIIAGIFLSFVLLGETALTNSPQEPLFLALASRMADLLIPYFYLFFFLCFGYFTLFHFVSGQTPGKMLCRLRVEDEEGESLDVAQAFLRSAAGLLSLLALGAGYWAILWDSRGRGWNDRLAGTRVVSTEADG